MRRFILTSAAALIALAAIPCASQAQNATKAQPAKAGAAANLPPKIDLNQVEAALAKFDRKQFAEAERDLIAVVAAIDADPSQANPLRNRLGDCLRALFRSEHILGHNELARLHSERYRTLIETLLAKYPSRRDQELDENAMEKADILVALDRGAEAEAPIREQLAAAEPNVTANPVRVFDLRVKLAQLADTQDDDAKARQRWSKVVALGKQIIDGVGGKPLPDDDFVRCAKALAQGYVVDNQVSAAIEAYTKLYNFQLTRQRDAKGALDTLIIVAAHRAKLGEFETALKLFDRIDAAANLLKQSGREAELCSLKAAVFDAQGLPSQAQKQWTKSAAIDADELRHLRDDPAQNRRVMDLLNSMQIALRQSQHYREAIDPCQELLKLRIASAGETHPLTIAAKSDLGALYGQLENYEAARPLLQAALDFWSQRKPPAPLQLSRALNDLAVVERGVGSYDDARRHFNEALKLRKQSLEPNDTRLAQSYVNLASVLLDQANYSQAVVFLDQAVEIYQHNGSGAQEPLSRALLNEARVYRSQGLLDKAAEYCQQSLDVLQKAVGPNSAAAIDQYNTMAGLCIARRDFDQAAEHANRAWQLCLLNHLEQDPIAGDVLYQKARVEYKQNRLAEAKSDWQAALKIEQAGGQTALAARTLNYLADTAAVHDPQGAEQMYRQALGMQGSAQAHPAAYFITSCRLAEILDGKGQRDDAIKLVQNAVKIIETPRANTIGGEAERAEFFAEFAAAFDLLVSWNLEQGNVEKAFEFAERGRNRTFLDQLSLVGVDLRNTLGPEGEKLRERECTLRTKFATLQAAARTADPANGAAALIDDLKKTQVEYAQVLAEIHNASPYYRERLSQTGPSRTLESLRKQLAKIDSVMLFYYAGAKQSYLLVVDPASAETNVVPLKIPDQLADAMKVKAGPITRASLVQLVSQYLADVRDRAGGRGLAGTVISEKGVMAADQGTVLASVLVPPAVRTAIEKRQPQSVIIVPDGALNELPFEALLLERTPSPKYLLDVFPPIAYTPSANILLNLTERPAPVGKTTTALTLGNPKYPEGPADVAVQRSVADATRAAYLGFKGVLSPLAATKQECDRIGRALSIAPLLAEQATEKSFRDHLPGCRFVHVAAHGLIDQQNENLFGAIALTPPAKPADSNDDGFLSVNEIFNLPLSGCELVALSACQTNVGPDRPLEAGSTIAQAFLAAGARRAVCSHWNVDDASTAELMGGFFERIAKATSASNGLAAQGESSIAYAKALHDAQLNVRSQAKWSSPYYWAPFVLMGPPQ